jgi:hypothetical protein
MTAAPDTPAAWARPLYEQQIAMLGRLAEKGMGIAEGVAEDAGAASERVAIDFARAARAVRLTLMLQAKLIKDPEDRDRLAAQDADRADWSRKVERTRQAFDQKERLGRIVERIAEGDPEVAHEAEDLANEARERLDEDDIYGDILTRPVSELVAMICKDLGLDPDWPKLAEEAWAREEMAGDVGWPLAALAALTAETAPSQVRFKVHASSP